MVTLLSRTLRITLEALAPTFLTVKFIPTPWFTKGNSGPTTMWEEFIESCLKEQTRMLEGLFLLLPG